MSKRIIVLGGCGAMGSEVTRDLVHTSDFEEIIVADKDLSKAHALVDELGGGRVRAEQIDVADQHALAEKLSRFDVVANATTYHFGLIATRAAIRAGVNYLDLGGLFNTPKQLDLDEDARKAGITICLGCGATPGVTNLMTRHAADQMDQLHEVHIAFASFRSIAPSAGLLDTVLDEFSPGSRRFYWQDGKLIDVPAFSGSKRVKFSEPVGEIDTYYVPHSETHTLSRSLGKGVRQIDVRGTWRPQIMQALRLFADLKLTSDESVQFDGRQVNSKAFLREHILQTSSSFGSEGEWAFLLNVEVLGRSEGKSIRIVSNTSHPPNVEWGNTATARMTGIPASIAAQKLARGEARRAGVMAPDTCFEPVAFFGELAKRGIRVTTENTQDWSAD